MLALFGRQLIRVLSVAILIPNLAIAADWLTFAHDPQRSGWAIDEFTLSPLNVADLELKWKTRVNNKPKALAALTAPLIASDVVTQQGIKTLVYVAGSSNNVHAIDALSGSVVWTRELQSYTTPSKPDQWLCPNNLNATPVIDKRAGILYLITMDGKLVGVDLGTGSNRFGPVQFVPPFSKSWSLNLANGTIYTSLSQGCGGGASGLYSMDIREPFNPITRHLLVNNAGGGGIWGRGGPVIGANGRVYGATGDGLWEPSRGFYGSSIVAASINDLRLVDYYTPRNWKDINDYDWDISCSSPVWFANQNYQLLAVGGKEGVVYLMDADSLGSKDHHSPLYITPRLANDEDTFEGKGVWGALSAWTDLNGESWVYVPIWGPASSKAPKFPVSNGDAPHGQIMAFKVVLDTVSRRPKLEPQWKSGDLNVPDPPVIANGVLFVLSTGENVQQTKEGGVIKWNKLTLLTDAERQGRTQRAKLYAIDAKTGKTLWDSGELMDTWVHFSGLAVANSRIYAVDHNSQVYSFGLKEKAN